MSYGDLYKNDFKTRDDCLTRYETFIRNSTQSVPKKRRSQWHLGAQELRFTDAEPFFFIPMNNFLFQ